MTAAAAPVTLLKPKNDGDTPDPPGCRRRSGAKEVRTVRSGASAAQPLHAGVEQRLGRDTFDRDALLREGQQPGWILDHRPPV